MRHLNKQRRRLVVRWWWLDHYYAAGIWRGCDYWTQRFTGGRA